MVVENPKNKSNKKIIGVIALVLGSLLSLGVIGNLKAMARSIDAIIKSIIGKTDAYELSYAISSLIIPLLMAFFAVRLLRFGIKRLFNHSQA